MQLLISHHNSHGSVRVLQGRPARSMGNAIYWGLPAPKPLGRFSKKCTVDYVGESTPHASIGVNRFKCGVSTHAWNCHPQACIFSFLK